MTSKTKRKSLNEMKVPKKYLMHILEWTGGLYVLMILIDDHFIVYSILAFCIVMATLLMGKFVFKEW